MGPKDISTVFNPVGAKCRMHDALAPLGVTDIEMPFTAEKVWRSIRNARPPRAA